MNRLMRLKIIPAVLLGLLLCAAGLFWPEPEARRSLTVAVTIWPGSEGLVEAEDDGSLEGRRVNLVEMSWPTAAMGAFRKRVVDGIVLTLDEMLKLEADGAKPRAVLIMGVSKGSDAIMVHPDISSFEALRGKRVGVEMRSSGEYLLTQALAAHGMTLQDVDVVPVNLAETESAYDERDLDAVVTSDPWRIKLQDKGAVTLFDSKGAGLEFSRVLAIREDALKLFPSEVHLMVSACLRLNASKGISGNEGELNATLRRQGLTALQLQEALKLIHFPDEAENRRLMEQRSGGMKECLEKMIPLMRQQGMLQREVKAEGLFTPEFLGGNR